MDPSDDKNYGRPSLDWIGMTIYECIEIFPRQKSKGEENNSNRKRNNKGRNSNRKSKKTHSHRTRKNGDSESYRDSKKENNPKKEGIAKEMKYWENDYKQKEEEDGFKCQPSKKFEENPE